MKFKIFSMLLLTVFLSVLTVSAATNFTVSRTSLEFSEPTNSLTFTLTPVNPGSNYSISLPILYDNNNNPITFTASGNLQNINSAQLITINTNVDFSQISLDKSYTGNAIIQESNNPLDNQTITISLTKSFCKFGENGTDLSITEVKIKNAGTTDDTEWKPLDEIEVDVRVENTGTDKVREVNVELGLLDANGRNVINNMDSLSDKKISLGTLNDGNDDIAKFTFNVPIDFKVDDYKLIAKAYSSNKGEKALCTARSSDFDNTIYQSISGTRESNTKRQIIVNNIQVVPDTAQCGDKVQVSADVVNIGDTDYTDQVKVNMYNKELGINIDQIIRQDFNQGDSSNVDFEFDVPKNAKEKSYTLEFTTYYDYDTKKDSYKITSDKKFVNFNSPFKVEGNCQSTQPQNVNAQITSTELSSDTPEAIAGNRVVVQATIKNTGDVDTSYQVSVTGNSAWSNLVSIDPQSLTISPGSSKVVNIALDLDKSAEGTKDFTIGLAFSNKTTQYSVRDFTITKTSQQVQSDAIVEHLKANWLIYVIVLVNVILIIAIIMVIRRMLRPRTPRM
jgi:uncharacterized membrane protein